MDSRTPTTVNEVQSYPLDESHAINEITSNSSYRNKYSNNHGKSNYNGKPWQNRDNKHWQNKDNKPWQNKDKSHGKAIKAKVINPRDTCFTLSQDQKFFIPADCHDNVFQIICAFGQSATQQGETIRWQWERN